MGGFHLVEFSSLSLVAISFNALSLFAADLVPGVEALFADLGAFSQR